MPGSHRGHNLLLVEYWWTTGSLLVVILAYFTLGHGNPIANDSEATMDIIALSIRGFSEFWGAWRVFVMLCSLPCFFSTFWGLCFVPESPRWLMTTKDDHEGALRVLRRAARINGKDPYEVFPENIRLLREGDAEIQNDHRSHFSEIFDMFSPRWLKTTLMLWGTWLGFGILYYGNVIVTTMVFAGHAVHQTSGKPATYHFDYGALFISNAAEIVGTTLVVITVDSWGRIKTQSISYLLSGILVLTMCLLSPYTDHDHFRYLMVILAFGARMLTMAASCVTWVSTAEVLTTEVRATGHSAANACARLGGFFCPYVVSPAASLNTIGYCMFAIGCFTALCAFNVPETLGVGMGGQATNTHRNGGPGVNGKVV